MMPVPLLHPRDGAVFEVTVFKEEESQSIGLYTSQREGPMPTLVVDAVRSPSPMSEWNEENPTMAVTKGDKVIAVNGVSTLAKAMIEEISTSGEVVFLTILRPHIS